MARTYGGLQKFAESLALSSKAHLYLREAQSIFASSSPISEDFYPVTLDDVAAVEHELNTDDLRTKMEWYTFNGGQISAAGPDGTTKPFKKPLFFDVAFNYVELPMDNLIARSTAGVKTPTPAPPAIQPTVVKSTPTPAEPSSDPRKEREKRSTKVEEAPPPEVKIVQTSSLGLGGILGGWWGRK